MSSMKFVGLSIMRIEPKKLIFIGSSVLLAFMVTDIPGSWGLTKFSGSCRIWRLAIAFLRLRKTERFSF